MSPWWPLITTTLALGASAVSLPGCQGAAPTQTTLKNVTTAFVSVPNHPFGISYAKQKNIAFVALAQDQSNVTSSLAVLNTSAFAPTLKRNIRLPPAYVEPYGVEGLGTSHDGRDVFVCSGPGLIAVNASAAIAGCADAVVATLNGTTSTQDPGHAAIEVSLSGDDQYAFVSQEYGPGPNTRGNVDVFKLQKSKNNASVAGTPIGFLPLSYAVVGTVLSPNGSIMYATSESAGGVNYTAPGTLSVIDVKKLETNPAQALITSVSAGCNPVRAIVSSDGKVVWVTARESNHLLAFDTAKLISQPDSALLASVQVGTAPVGLTFVRNETRILTADSNRFALANATSGISVVDVEAALGGSSQAVLGRVPAGLFPREFTVSPDGRTVLVSNYMSLMVQAIDVTTLP